MKNSFNQEMRRRFVLIYVATISIIIIIATLQYINLVENEINFQKKEILKKTPYFIQTNDVKFVSKTDILSASLLEKSIPLRIIKQGKVHILFYTPKDNYYRFLIRPIVAISCIILFIYFVLNRVLKKWLFRLREFKKFLYSYLENSIIDERLFMRIKQSDDEIYKLSVDAKKLMDDSLKISKKQKNFIKILEELNEVVLVISNEFDVLEYNKPWLEFEQKSSNFLDYLNEANIEKLEIALSDLQNSKIPNIIFVDTLHKEESYFEIKIIHTKSAFGVIIRDVSSIYKKHQETKHMALHDSLTNLPNRMLFLDRLSTEIKKSKREDRIFAVLFFDLDKFKEVNDKYGHEAGDLVLVEFSKRVSGHLRASDTLARLGGDEFVGIISDITHISEIDLVVEKIHTTLEQAVVYNNHSIYINTSIGVSIYPDNGVNVDVLMLKADNAMYRCKKNSEKYCKYNEEL